MIGRRDFIAAAAALGLVGESGIGRRAAARRLRQDDLLAADDAGDLTILHLSDLHAQVKPIHFREPSVNLGVGPDLGLPPHLTGETFLAHYDIAPGSPEAHALTSVDFTALAQHYGKMGGLDRIAAVIDRIRAERYGKTLVLDGGDSWQGSYVANATAGGDMVKLMSAVGIDAMTAHWEFTYGESRVTELVSQLPFPFLAGNVFDNEWDEPVFEPYRLFLRHGLAIAVIGQAFPYTPIANPRRLIPKWSFGIRERTLIANIAAARKEGADLIVLLSHNGFDVDRKLASRVEGIDIILSGHTHDALPRPALVGETFLIASGSNGKFISRLDLDIRDRRLRGLRHRLIPIFSDVITPDPRIAALIDEQRAPYVKELERELALTESLLYRRGNFNGSLDDLILDAIRERRDAEIAFSPGFRWGTSLLPGQIMTVEDLHNACAVTYPETYRRTMSGAQIKFILESVADNLFHADPYYRQGGDMVRIGGMGCRIDPYAAGDRISDMTALASGEPIDPSRDYVVAGWASVEEGVEGPPVWEVVEDYLKERPVIRIPENRSIAVKGASIRR